MRTARIAAGLGGLVVTSLILRSTALGAGYWIDEGLSVGIASHPLGDIPGILRQDGSPPLYYLLLHVWMAVFGERESATHALSLVFALVAVPVAWWAGRAVDGERCGWIAAALVATNGYLTYYAQETRMYSLVVLLSLVCAGLAARVFITGDRRGLPWLIAALGATVLAHNWGLFLVAAILIAGVLTGARAGRGDRARVAALAAGGVAVLYAAWVPTLLAQVAHTGAPWAQAPDLGDLAGTAAGGLGGTGPALLLLAGGLLCVLRLRRQTPPVVVLMAVSAVGVVTFAFVASQVEPAWAGRYIAVAVGPLVLLVACLLARSATLGLAALMVVSILGLTDPRTHQLEHKDNVRAVAAWLRTTGLDAADVVVSAHPERGPVLYHYLGPGPRYADLLGPVDDPRAFDWRDAFDRLERPAPARIAGDLVASIRPGSLLVLMVPEVRGSGWSAPWTRLVRARSLAWERLLIADVRLRRLGAVPGATGAPRPRSVFAVVFRRVA